MNKVSKRLYVPHKSGGSGYDHDLGNIAFGNPMDLIGKSDCERKRQKKIRDNRKKLGIRPVAQSQKAMHTKFG